MVGPASALSRRWSFSLANKASLYYHTLRHLKWPQLSGRLLFKLRHPRPNLDPAPPLRGPKGAWAHPAQRRQSLLAPALFQFLNQQHTVSDARAWNDPAREKLWLYNLHYFDDLNAEGSEQRATWQRALLSRWVAENPPGQGAGWEPYPLGLRIVNWIKWCAAGNAPEPAWLHSLAVQARFLSGRLERHLLGNHLFANAKALVFAGLFFDGSEAAHWLSMGMSILEQEIPEQILADGGQFERSPMYHALALEDMLDLINISRRYAKDIPARWQPQVASWPQVAARMRRWLNAMCHPDGEIAFFNDAAIGVAPAPAALHSYAQSLGVASGGEIESLTHLEQSGYLRMNLGACVALLDAAPVGPDYLPAHAHADTLSFELSLFGSRVLVNSGTSCYGVSAERARQRGTAAHNTVVVDGENSSEVWGGFRVARRARPVALAVTREGETMRVASSHDGYLRLPGRVTHRRAWTLVAGALHISDELLGQYRQAEARLHLHPAISVGEANTNSALLVLAQGQRVQVSVSGGALRVAPATWHPEFGQSIANVCLVVEFNSAVVNTRITWSAA
jgi:uncharacterized heparinase superfamily protein